MTIEEENEILNIDDEDNEEINDELDFEIFNVYDKLTKIHTIPEKTFPKNISLIYIRIKNNEIIDIEQTKFNIPNSNKIEREFLRNLVSKKYNDNYKIQQILYYNNSMTHNDVEHWVSHKKPFKGFLISVVNKPEIQLNPSLFIFHHVSTLYILLKPKTIKKSKHTKRIIQPLILQPMYKSIFKQNTSSNNENDKLISKSKTKKVQIKPELNTKTIY